MAMSSWRRCLSASSLSMSAARARAAPLLSALVIGVRAAGLASVPPSVGWVLRVRARFSSVIAIDARPFGRSDRLRWQEACRPRQRTRRCGAAIAALVVAPARCGDAVEHHADVSRCEQDAGQGRAGGKPALRRVGLREIVHQAREEQDAENYRS